MPAASAEQSQRVVPSSGHSERGQPLPRDLAAPPSTTGARAGHSERGLAFSRDPAAPPSATGARAGHRARSRPLPRDPALDGVSIEVLSRQSSQRPEQVRAAANRGLSSLTFPRPVPYFAPPAQRTRTLVGIDTWFWVPAASWRPIVRIVAAGKVVVTLVATPVALQLLPGDGSPPVTCPGPGRPWRAPRSRSLCSHVFQNPSVRSPRSPTGRFHATVQSLWHVRWTSSTGLAGSAGPIPVAAPVSLRVAEAQPVLSRR